MGLQRKWIYAAIFLVCALGLGLGLGFGLSSKEELEDKDPVFEFPADKPCIEDPNTGCFREQAAATDDRRCSIIANNILTKGGSAVDSAIAAIACEGVVNGYHSGIGGAGFMTVYDEKTGKAEFFNCRERAPLASTEDMFKDKPNEAMHGPLAIAVPGEVKCMKEAHARYGSLPWSDIFQPSVDLARNGWELWNYTYFAMEDKADFLQGDFISWAGKNWTGNWEPYLKSNGKIKTVGDEIRDEELAQTLEMIQQDPDSFYNGPLADLIIEDLKELNATITKEDLQNYKALVSSPLESTYGDLKFFFPRAPSSGPILQLMMNIIEGYKLTPESRVEPLANHRIVESMKHGYAIRTGLGDPEFYPYDQADLEKKITDPDFIDAIRANITYQTHDINYYNPIFQGKDDHGTLSVSTQDKNGQAVAVTTTVNLYFGSKLRGRRTGITFNDGMDDFSTTGFNNDFGVPPSPMNFVKGGKRCVSSMAPTIAIDKLTGKAKIVLGAAGGTKITTGIYQVLVNKIWLGYSGSDSVRRHRFHHQLDPNEINWSDAVDGIDGPDWEEMIRALERDHGHKLRETGRMWASPVVQAIFTNSDTTIEGVSDWRHGGVPDGK